MSDATSTQTRWIRAPQLRKRWGDMPSTTFHRHLQKGLIPKPQHPFGPHTPYWAMADIEAFEMRASETANLKTAGAA